MARNNIYAPSASGGSTNWAAGISGALTDLSKSFRAQGDSELERDRLAAKDKKEETRYNAQEARLLADRKLKADARKDSNTLGNLKVNIGFGDLGQGVQDKASNTEKGIEKLEEDYTTNIVELTKRRGAIDEDGKLSPYGTTLFDTYKTSYLEALPPAEAEAKAMEAVRGIQSAAKDNDYDVKAKKHITSAREALVKGKVGATANATVQEFVEAGQRQLESAGHANPFSAEVRADLANRAKILGLRTGGEYRTADVTANKAAYDNAYQKEKDRISYLKDYYSASKSAGRSTDGSYKGATAKDWAEFTSNLDAFGTGDKDRANTLFSEVRSAHSNLPAGFIREAIMARSGGKFWDAETPASTKAEIKAIGKMATSLGTGTGPTVNKDAFKINEAKLAELKPSNSLAGRLNLRTPKFTGKLSDIPDAKKLIQGLAKAKEEIKKAAVVQTTKDVQQAKAYLAKPTNTRAQRFSTLSPEVRQEASKLLGGPKQPSSYADSPLLVGDVQPSSSSSAPLDATTRSAARAERKKEDRSVLDTISSAPLVPKLSVQPSILTQPKLSEYIRRPSVYNNRATLDAQAAAINAKNDRISGGKQPIGTQLVPNLPGTNNSPPPIDIANANDRMAKVLANMEKLKSKANSPSQVREDGYIHKGIN